MKYSEDDVLFDVFGFCSPAASGWSSESRHGEDDENHALVASRVLVGVALGLARAGLVANAAKEVVKAAAVRPRCASR